jgi:hypothetical protein
VLYRLDGRSANGPLFRSLLCPDFYLFYRIGENPDTKATAAASPQSVRPLRCLRGGSYGQPLKPINPYSFNPQPFNYKNKKSPFTKRQDHTPFKVRSDFFVHLYSTFYEPTILSTECRQLLILPALHAQRNGLCSACRCERPVRNICSAGSCLYRSPAAAGQLIRHCRSCRKAYGD